MNTEAPEKIYINSSLEDRIWLIGKGDTSFIEYTRTDTFIEKACDWIENNLLSSNQQDKSRLYFEQFKKYVKGDKA